MSDDLSSYRSEFPITERYTFLNHAAVSPTNRRITAALHAHAERTQNEHFLKFLPDRMALHQEVRQRIASLINARGIDEIALMSNTAMGINTAATSLPLQAGDNVLLLEGDYPANIYPWQNLAYRGVLTRWVPQRNGGLDITLLEQRIDRRTRVIALSTAMFATGFRNDIAAVGQLCQERGIFFVVDGIQTLGAFPIDVQACHIDFLAAGSQKWLLSAEGSGFLYCRRELFPELQPGGTYVGASSVVDPFNYLDYNFTLPDNADRFNLGTTNWLGIVALNATLALLQEVGHERIASKINQLVETLIHDLSERGYQFAASTAPEHRCGFVVAQVPDPQETSKKLVEADIIVMPRGPGIRIAPHFYNSFDEVLRVGDMLEKIVR